MSMVLTHQAFVQAPVARTEFFAATALAKRKAVAKGPRKADEPHQTKQGDFARFDARGPSGRTI